MSRISIEDLKKQSAERWLQDEDVVVTSQGRPVAVLVPTDADSLEPTLTTLRSVRALQAQAALQETAAKNGSDKMTSAEIEAEIAATRRARRK